MPIFEPLKWFKNRHGLYLKVSQRGPLQNISREAYFQNYGMLILGKKKQKMLKLCFYLIHLNLVKTPKFNTMQKTSTWQTHLPYLQVETLLQYRIHQSNTGNYHCMHWLSKTPSWVTKEV